MSVVKSGSIRQQNTDADAGAGISGRMANITRVQQHIPGEKGTVFSERNLQRQIPGVKGTVTRIVPLNR